MLNDDPEERLTAVMVTRLDRDRCAVNRILQASYHRRLSMTAAVLFDRFAVS